MKKKPEFTVKSEYSPAGDQPTAIAELSESILKGNRYQMLENVKMPTIIMTHNKTLAAQFIFLTTLINIFLSK